jgi:hypothetical protein
VPGAKVVNRTVGATYLLLGIAGFFVAASPINILALDTGDHFLHLASAVLVRRGAAFSSWWLRLKYGGVARSCTLRCCTLSSWKDEHMPKKVAQTSLPDGNGHGRVAAKRLRLFRVWFTAVRVRRS